MSAVFYQYPSPDDRDEYEPYPLARCRSCNESFPAEGFRCCPYCGVTFTVCHWRYYTEVDEETFRETWREQRRLPDCGFFVEIRCHIFDGPDSPDTKWEFVGEGSRRPRGMTLSELQDEARFDDRFLNPENPMTKQGKYLYAKDDFCEVRISYQGKRRDLPG